ncbi:MAG TPA: hypothetical protein VH302_10930 [Bryobacteraceae bacterium]|jgi:hypothetical protein|nr:hypothetical protein [Bryobacteraceae bacterium]
MSKKNRHGWQNQNASQSPVAAPAPKAEAAAAAPTTEQTLSVISPAQLAANRANAQLSTGPRTAAGLAKSSQNAVKSALTGRTVLLPTDDREEYAALITEFQNEFSPVGQFECELVQIVVDCHWRLRRIQELEYALYAHGERQFAEAFADEPMETRHSMIVLQTHLTYQKELRNLHIQESRIDRKRVKALAELKEVQAQRQPASEYVSAYDNVTEEEGLAMFAAGYIPPEIAENLARMEAREAIGFDFSNAAASADQPISTKSDATRLSCPQAA